MRRNAVQIAQLINAQPQRQLHGRLDIFQLPSRIMVNQIIELPLKPQTSKDQLRGKAGVSCVHPRGFFQQQIRCISAACRQVKNVVGNTARGRDSRRMAQLLIIAPGNRLH